MPFVIDKILDIEAPADVVWEVISDFSRYGEWNPFVVSCRTSLVPGEPIDMQVKVFEAFAQSQREWIFDNRPGVGFSYGLKGSALASRRSHEIQPVSADRSRYVSHFELTGWLAPIVKALMSRNLERGFAGMSNGIKRQAEKLYRERRGS
jgi:hypothetical protein